MPRLHTGQSLGMGLPLVAKEGGPSPGMAMLEAQGFWLLPRHKMSVSIEEPLMAGKNFFFLIWEPLCPDFSCWAFFLVTS